MNAGTRPARRRTAAFGAIAVAATLLTSACAAGRVAQTIRQTPAIDGVNAQAGSVAVRYLSIVAPSGTSYPAGSSVRLTGVFANSGTTADQLVDISTSAFSSWGAYTSIAAGDQVAAASTSSASASASPAASSESAADSPSGSPSGSPASGAAGSGASSGRSSGSASGSPATASGSSATASGPAAPVAVRSVAVPAGGRTSFGVPEATGALLLLDSKAALYPGTQIRVTLTFARAGQVTVNVPVQITENPVQASVPAPSGSAAENGS